MNIYMNTGWVEIIEPKTRKKVFVNTGSGKCQWNPPEQYQHVSDDQWWELYDFKSCHLYYYNVKTKQTSWCKPNVSNLVSLVKLQVLKNKKNKTFEDKGVQTSREDLKEYTESDIDNQTSAFSLDFIDLSGAISCENHSVNHENEDCKSCKSNCDDQTLSHKELSSTLPVPRKYIPRTNPNYTRHSQTLRLSQPVIGMYDETILESSLPAQKLYASSKTIDDDENKNYLSVMSLPNNKGSTFDDNRFPRKSVIHAIEREAFTSTVIWSRNLFNKSDNQLAGWMSWTSKTIPDSLLALTPKSLKRKVCENFKQIQMYMGDRDPKASKDVLAYTICQRGISNSNWANEIFMQLCKQVTFNPNSERTFYGWELICICLKFFHPESVEMQNCFKSFLIQYACFENTLDMKNIRFEDFKSRSIFCARVALKLLNMSNKATGLKIGDVLEAKKSYGCSTIFYSSPEEVMELQKQMFPYRKLPWIQVALSEEIFRCDGCKTQGIFRIPSEVSKIDSLTQAIERAFRLNNCQDLYNTRIMAECDPLLNQILDDLDLEHDPLLLASVLKNWFRHLCTPLIFFSDNDEEPLSVVAKDFNKIMRKIDSLPQINMMILKHLIRFLQILSSPENVTFTNMPVENLVTLMAPTLFKTDIQLLQPAMHLLQNLVLNWDTSDMENVR